VTMLQSTQSLTMRCYPSCVGRRDADDDYYALLGLATDADDDAIRRAWRRLALEWHPDRAGPGTTHTFQRLSRAYAVISDPAERAAYDKRRGITRRAQPAPPPASAAAPGHADAPAGERAHAGASTREPAPDAPIGRRAPGVLLHRLSGPLNILLARGVAREASDGVIELLIDDSEASEGGMVTISMRVPVSCDACALDARAPCGVCGNERVVEDLYAAWLAIRPGVADGTIVTPSAKLPNMIKPVAFRVLRQEA
jgi:hypothetical protein